MTAQPQAEPVAWRAITNHWPTKQDEEWRYGPWADGLGPRFQPLYTAPQFYCNKCGYTGPQQSYHYKPDALRDTVCQYDAVPVPAPTAQPQAAHRVFRSNRAR